ncbi:HEAT repeat domain-containing protein [Sorangium sp. So ce542]|uniref:HEAT repeat domain-containing protein n=1 Tax=Sorangium sp. So ce542 TaxID=3133316 RepID=UPI003F5EEBAC
MRASTLLAGLLVSAAAGADDLFALPDASQAADKVALYRCRALGFDGSVSVADGAPVECSALLARVCAEHRNAEKGVCLQARFELCKIDNFPGNACQATLRLVCDKTGDQWDRACDKLRYETCKKARFEGEVRIGTREGAARSCAQVRREFILPVIEKEVSEVDRMELARPRDWNRALCGYAGGDVDHPFHAYCPGDSTPKPSSVDELVDMILAVSEGAPGGAARKASLLARFLGPAADAEPADGSAAATPWDSVGALAVWLDAAEDPHADLRYQALRLLSRYGDDDFMPAFLLTMAAGDADERVRVAALRSLGRRRYRSGLVMAVLARGLSAESSAVRAAAFEGLARRWDLDARGGYAAAVGKALEGLFPCPATLSRDATAAFDRVASLDDLKAVKPETHFCLFGVGLDLMRLRDQVLRRYLEAARRAETVEEQAAAVAGLRLLAVASDMDRLKQVALGLLQHPADELRLAALTLLSGLRRGADETVGHLEAELRGRLLAAGDVSWKHVEGVFRLLFEQGKTRSFRAAGGVYDRGNAVPLAIECIERDALAVEIRTRCFALISSSIDMGDENVEAAYAGVLQETLRSGSYKDRMQAIGFLSGGRFSFVDDEINGTETLKKQVAGVLAAEIERMLRARLGRDAPLFPRYAAALRRVLASKHAEMLHGLASDGALKSWIAGRLRSNAPSMDLGKYLERYKPEVGDLIEPTKEMRVHDPVIGRTRVYYDYQATKPFNLMVLSRYARCTFQERRDGPVTLLDNIEIDSPDKVKRYEAMSLGQLVGCTPKRGMEDIVVHESTDVESELFQYHKELSSSTAADAKEELWNLKPVAPRER